MRTIGRLAKTGTDLKQQFDADGYVVLCGFLSALELKQLEVNFERFVREVAPTMPQENVFYEDKNKPESLKQLVRMHEFDGYFRDLFLSDKFKGLAEVLLDDEVDARNMQYFGKAPGVSKPTPPHQDGYYFWITPCEAVTFWLAMDDVDEENGCVRYVHGSHKQGLRPHTKTNVLGFSQGIADYGRPEDVEVPCRVKRGDMIVHHALTVHRADGNRSAARSRRSLGFIYFAKSSQEDAAGKDAYQKRLKQEMLSTGKI